MHHEYVLNAVQIFNKSPEMSKTVKPWSNETFILSLSTVERQAFKSHAFHWKSSTVICRTIFSSSPFVLESRVDQTQCLHICRRWIAINCTKYILFRINNSVRLWTKMDICFYSFLLFWMTWFPTKPSTTPNDGTSVHCQLVIGIRETCDRQSEI